MMNDGGSAFPVPGIPGKYVDAGCGDTYTTADTPARGGMSLLDYFAGQAMLGWLASYEGDMPHPSSTHGKDCHPSLEEITAQLSYDLAQAMLAERAKRQA